MGRHWAMKRAGGNASFGQIPPPPATSFSIGAPTVPNTTITLIGSIVFPATEWATRSVQVSNGTETVAGSTSGTTRSAFTPSAATAYRIYVAWFNPSNVRISEWTSLGTITTP